MARISIPLLESLPEAQQAAISKAESIMGFVANDALIMAKNSELMHAFSNLVAAIYRPGLVDSGLKRLLGMVTSAASGCQYCVGHTVHTSRKNGIDDKKLADAWNFEQSKLFDAAEKAALRVAMHAGQSPNGVTDEMYGELASHYNDDEQLEIVAVIALFGFLNRWNSTLATDLESSPLATLQQFRQPGTEEN